ncbi:MAG: hypothetical protein AABW67_04480 [Nanoarchaeota archaeon]
MLYKINNKKAIGKSASRKLLLIGIILISIISLVFLVSALTSENRTSLQSEFDSLTADLNNNGYSWLTDYSINYPSVEVYREGGNESIAKFENVSSEGWYKIYLTNLSENETQDVFDLKSGKYEKISYEIYLKKIRIDEIRKELNQEGGMFKY